MTMKRFVPASMLAVALASGLLAASFLLGRGLPSAGAIGSIETCLNMTFPAQAGVSTLLDTTAQTIEFSWLDPTTKSTKVSTVRYVDPTCQSNPETKQRIDEALELDLEWTTEICQSLQRIVNGQDPVPVRNGTPMSVPAASTYMANQCTPAMLSAS